MCLLGYSSSYGSISNTITIEIFITSNAVRSNFCSVDYSRGTALTPTVILKSLACLWDLLVVIKVAKSTNEKRLNHDYELNVQVARLKEQLQKERDLRMALEAGLKISQGPLPNLANINEKVSLSYAFYFIMWNYMTEFQCYNVLPIRLDKGRS